MLRMVGGTGIIGQDIICPLSHSEEFAIKTASGNPITIQSAAAPFTEMLIFGKTTQDGTPSPENPVALDTAGASGQVNVGVGGGNLFNLGSFTFTSGTSVSGYSLAPSNIVEFFKTLANGDYYVSYTPKADGTLGTSAGKIALIGESNETLVNTTNQFAMTDEIRNNLKRVVMYGYYPSKINTVDDFMVNAGSTALPWEPYVTPQNLVVSTPTGLPGVPTTGEEYTYIDADGTKRIADSVEMFSDGTGRYVQRTWLEDVTLSYVSQYNRYEGALSKKSKTGILNCLSDSGIYASTPQASGECRVAPSSNTFIIKSDVEIATCKVLYILEEPIITPLSAEQVAAFKALTTYEPTTVIQNDAGCWMQVKYASKNIY